jgi:ELWxxDGT repeat protein
MLRLILFLLLLVQLPLRGLAQVPQLVKDLSAGKTDSYFEESIAFKGRLLFTMQSRVTGGDFWQLWITDGTANGTQWLRTFSWNYSPHGFTILNDKVYFIGNDTAFGQELWVTDGTNSGTSMVKDIFPGWKDGVSTNPVMFHGSLYFGASDSVHGIELWKSDGTTSGTQMAVDLFPGTASSNLQELVASDNLLVFTTSYSSNGRALWISDGSAGGSHSIYGLSGGTPGATLQFLFAVKDKVFFEKRIYQNSGPPGIFFSVTDGTAAGTVDLMYDLSERPESAVLNDKVYFYGTLNPYGSTNHAEGLFVTDGTAYGTHLVRGGISYSCFGGNAKSMSLTVFNQKLYFSAGVDTHFRHQLWTSDGTTAGTTMVKDFGPPGTNILGSPTYLLTARGRMYMKAWDEAENRCNVWQSDGTTSGTTAIKYPGANHSTYDLCSELSQTMTVVDSFLYYGLVYDTASTGIELYRLQTSLAVSELPDKLDKFELYPVPANQNCNLKCSLQSAAIVDMDIVSMDGKVVQNLAHKQQFNSGFTQLSFPTATLPNGVYMLRIKTNGKSAFRKLVVWH